MTQVTLASPQSLDLTRPVPAERPLLRPRSEITQPIPPQTAASLTPKDTRQTSSAAGRAATSVPLAIASKPVRHAQGTQVAQNTQHANGYNPRLGKNLAAAGIRAANSMRSENWCYRGVKKALRIAYGKPMLSGGFAYQAAAQLARNPRFKEINVPASGLRKLPAGAIVVWKASRANNAGHISIALGDGRESSDHIQTQMTRNHGAGHRVFVPVK